MNYGEYYLTTIISAAKNLGPTLLLLVVGYIVFFKLSFIQIRKKEEQVAADAPKPESKKEDEKIKIEDKTQKEEKKTSSKPKPKTEHRPRPSKEEVLFQYAAGEAYSHKDLKKKYHKLLKDHHPDKVAQLDERRKEMAEKKTKEINSAYEHLKKKAS